MTFISTIAKKFQHEKTARDVYFENLEEAYGNLPVPSDDYADIKELLKMSEEEFEKLQEATEVIMNHYIEVAKALGKNTKFN